MMKRNSDKKIKKIVLAYSGGLDTSVMIPWLKEHYDGAEVIAVTGDLGQGGEMEGLEPRALAAGASKHLVADLKKEFVEDFIFPTLKAGAVYEKSYLLGTAMARPLLGRRLAEIALAEGAAAVCHGCTGKGNDQVRFELAIKATAPQMTIIAPWRFWELQSRDDEIAYAEARHIELTVSRETNYSKDGNLWHLSHEGLDLEDPSLMPRYNDPSFLEISAAPAEAPDLPCDVKISFEKGIPVALNDEVMDGLALVTKLNEMAGAHGIGIADLVENRLVGMKSRGVYETPGGTVLYKAHELLESICLDRATLHYKEMVALRFAELVYDGQWFTPLREALSAFVDSTQQNVTGHVKLKLYKGNIIPAGLSSLTSLYSTELVTFGYDEVYNQADAEGFINLFGLPITVKALMEQQRS